MQLSIPDQVAKIFNSKFFFHQTCKLQWSKQFRKNSSQQFTYLTYLLKSKPWKASIKLLEGNLHRISSPRLYKGSRRRVTIDSRLPFFRNLIKPKTKSSPRVASTRVFFFFSFRCSRDTHLLCACTLARKFTAELFFLAWKNLGWKYSELS